MTNLINTIAANLSSTLSGQTLIDICDADCRSLIKCSTFRTYKFDDFSSINLDNEGNVTLVKQGFESLTEY